MTDVPSLRRQVETIKAKQATLRRFWASAESEWSDARRAQVDQGIMMPTDHLTDHLVEELQDIIRRAEQARRALDNE